MLTGARAFAGDDLSDTPATLLKSDPDWRALPADTPVAIRRLLRRCLVKDPKSRMSDAAVARMEIDEALSPSVEPQPQPASSAPSVPVRRRSIALPLAAAVLVSSLASAAAVWLLRAPVPHRYSGQL